MIENSRVFSLTFFLSRKHKSRLVLLLFSESSLISHLSKMAIPNSTAFNSIIRFRSPGEEKRIVSELTTSLNEGDSYFVISKRSLQILILVDSSYVVHKLKVTCLQVVHKLAEIYCSYRRRSS